jgi:DNA polymerase III alpha subunit (gram-positive type)
MTILGKLLTFVVLVLALIWNALVVNAYVTRTNWKAEAERSQKSAREAADAAHKMKAQMDEERAAADDARRALREENERQYEQVKLLNERNTALFNEYQKAYKQLEQNAAQSAQFQANIDKYKAQVDSLNTQVSALEKMVDDKTKTESAALVTANTERLKAEALQKQNDDLMARVRDQARIITEYERSGLRLPSQFDPNRATPSPAGFRGSILKVDAPQERGGAYLVTLEPGADAGLQTGAELSISRFKPAPKYVGKVVILQADPKQAVGRFVPAAGRLGPDDLPRAGDTVEVR